MGRKPTPPPVAELAVVRQLTDQLEQIENIAGKLRRLRNQAMVIAKKANATGDHLADAARMNRRNVSDIVKPASDARST